MSVCCGSSTSDDLREFSSGEHKRTATPYVCTIVRRRISHRKHPRVNKRYSAYFVCASVGTLIQDKNGEKARATLSEMRYWKERKRARARAHEREVPSELESPRESAAAWHAWRVSTTGFSPYIGLAFDHDYLFSLYSTLTSSTSLSPTLSYFSSDALRT